MNALGPTGKLNIRTLKEQEGEDFFDFADLSGLIGYIPGIVPMATEAGEPVAIYAAFSQFITPHVSLDGEEGRRVREVLAIDACRRTYCEGRKAGFVDPHAY